MAEVARTTVPGKAELGAVFDEVFGEGDAEGSEWAQEANAGGGQEAQAPQEQDEQQDAAPVDDSGQEPVEQGAAEQAAAEATEQVEQEQQAKPGKKDAQSRIRQLAAEKNQLREELARTQQYVQRELAQLRTQSVTEAKAQREAMERQLELQRRQFDLLQSDREAAEFERLPIDKKIERRAAKESESRLRQELEERDRHWQARFEQLEAQREQEREQNERVGRIRGLDAQAEQALDQVVLKGLHPEDAKALREPMKEMLMSWAASYGEYPMEAAKRFAGYIDNVFTARLKTKRNPNVAPQARPGIRPAIGGQAGVAPFGARPVARRSTADSLKERGLHGHLRDLADELFG